MFHASGLAAIEEDQGMPVPAFANLARGGRSNQSNTNEQKRNKRNTQVLRNAASACASISPNETKVNIELVNTADSDMVYENNLCLKM
jgi:hypothetical protein